MAGEIKSFYGLSSRNNLTDGEISELDFSVTQRKSAEIDQSSIPKFHQSKSAYKMRAVWEEHQRGGRRKLPRCTERQWS